MDTDYDEDEPGEGLIISEDIRENSEYLLYVAFCVADMDAAMQLDPRIHEYSSSEMGEFALQPWWGLPATLTGLALQEATSAVVHALSFAQKLRVGGIGPLLEFLIIVNDPVSYQFSPSIDKLI